MSRRKTVALNLAATNNAIKKVFRHNVMFCEAMGRGNQPTWVSGWKATPPKNLPSPEEAAQMCALLQVQPEEILVKQEDIELVRGLIRQEMEKSTAAMTDVDEAQLDEELINKLCQLTPEELDKALSYIQWMIDMR